ncbi:unnamed protein product [Acanthoscelides obtectus]|uniref:Uncharacterized protein n=1 Tax=Acanthoscelides obtectus TaxID=200917 RepID=A0A9P0PRX6_ACAOB|nr:unnamed protein product [Acanthoscelides obtectus]CAK1640863.1 hypothetical protein AOBTE_LOCUS11978 [Acanthoscelides obtectus]
MRNDLVPIKSKSWFSRLKIDDSFLDEWPHNDSFQHAKNKVQPLRTVVNDTAERVVKYIQAGIC